MCATVKSLYTQVAAGVQAENGAQMPPRRRARSTRKIPEESEGQNEEIQRSIRGRRCTRHIDDEVDVLAAHVDEMELIMARLSLATFQLRNNAERWCLG
ncbi:putative galacturonosyltransferase 3 [Dorcoceras hygrometricum]|uniref:Putative galacturonosyltransferase 3 n=1 Tax=Dorcoceras hygrometricum TaxID=472368 RepID=A0A2Z7DD30_9LAMI|nr:putative galacturonosyltransferase 3 [Dorcoceras hygrometricum]